jgi:hypothetical protein
LPPNVFPPPAGGPGAGRLPPAPGGGGAPGGGAWGYPAVVGGGVGDFSCYG